MQAQPSNVVPLTKPEAGAPEAATETGFPRLQQVDKPTVSTAAAAYYLDRKPATLRAWASREDGPIRPVRVHGRLGWPVAGIKSLLGVA